MWRRIWGALAVAVATACLTPWYPNWIGYVLAAVLPPCALWYWLALRWLDRHRAWDRAGFPFGLSI